MKPDYRKTEEGKRRFANPKIYQKTLKFQEEMKALGVAWHNHYADECGVDFCCCEGDNLKNTTYHTYIPSFKSVVRQDLEELYEEIKHGDQAHQEWLKNKFSDYLNRY